MGDSRPELQRRIWKQRDIIIEKNERIAALKHDVELGLERLLNCRKKLASEKDEVRRLKGIIHYQAEAISGAMSKLEDI